MYGRESYILRQPKWAGNSFLLSRTTNSNTYLDLASQLRRIIFYILGISFHTLHIEDKGNDLHTLILL